ncbi:PQQ-binding-like beta-propeller repeat protein [Streptomyces sp. NPDC026673]|uniref:outer membrane protein assembly factor BamB family protein n=1 Tax=Streptomyces sp. NPDC026673 TaxID=3155724 RepID=UPI0033F2CD5C
MAYRTHLLTEADPAATRRTTVLRVFVVVISVLILLTQWYTAREVVTGNEGAFPEAFGTEAPTAPSHVTHLSHRPGAVVHGLSIDGTDSGVRAVNVRTGKEYWRYERGGMDDDTPSVGVSARTVAAWFEDGKLLGIDLRTGKVRWRTEFPSRGFQRLHMGAGQVVAQSPGGVAALSESNGKRLWTLRPPRSCEHPFPWDVHDFPDRLTVVQLECDSTDGKRGMAMGVDNRTGTTLWTRPIGQELDKTDDHTLVTVSPATAGRQEGTDRVQILDVDRKGAGLRAEFSSADWSPEDAGDGVIIYGSNPESADSAQRTALTAYSTQSGERAWERRADAGQSFGQAAIADGRVYVVQNSTISEGDENRALQADLFVLDARDGDLLHTLRLPAMTVPGDFFLTDLAIQGAGDGAVRVGWLESLNDALIVT